MVRLSGAGGPDSDACDRDDPRPGVGETAAGLFDRVTPVSSLLVVAFVLLFAIWAEVGIARTIRRFGRKLDALVFVGIHLALALGLAVGLVHRAKGLFAIVVMGAVRSATQASLA